ncbi:hypothetical protein J3R82DRAFT_7892 [Butyriboletus roseoflavus]|nr:hypothetical protein J3R82DRAFT_7892 [Butyriboletus roseoflavus]
MSAANSTDTGSVSPSAPSLNLNAIIHPYLSSLMLSHTFLSLLIPLFISLFYYSSPQSRRKVIFILNMTAISLAFVVGVLCDGVAIHSVLEPLNPWPVAVNLAIGFISVWQSIIVDLTLLIRVISVYPLAQLGPIRFSLLVAIPVLLKLLRVINLIVFTKVLVDAMNGPNAIVMAESAFSSIPYIKIEWAAQMIDNTYASVTFLRKLHLHGSNRIATNSSRVTLAQRIRTLFNIALTNFVVPTMFSIAQFACVYRGVDMVILDDIMLVNTMLATFGVAFATVWAGTTNRQEAQVLNSKRNDTAISLTAGFKGGSGHPANRASTVTIAGSGYTPSSRDENASK